MKIWGIFFIRGNCLIKLEIITKNDLKLNFISIK